MSAASEDNSPGKCGIVVLNYNGRDVLPGLLASLEKIDYPDFRVFLIDNASTDNSADLTDDWVDKFPIKIIRNDENLLFSRGNNVGIELALEWGAEYVFLLNNDTIVPPGILTELINYMDGKDKVGIAGPMIHFGAPASTIWGAGGNVSTWWGLVRHRGIREKDQGQFGKPAKVDYISGAAMMIGKEVINAIGMLDPDFPMYFEDTDFCFRARKAGYESWYVPTKPMIHLVSVAAGGQASKFKIQRRFSSGMKFFARHASWYQWPTIILGQVYEAIRVGLMVARGM